MTSGPHINPACLCTAGADDKMHMWKHFHTCSNNNVCTHIQTHTRTHTHGWFFYSSEDLWRLDGLIRQTPPHPGRRDPIIWWRRRRDCLFQPKAVGGLKCFIRMLGGYVCVCVCVSGDRGDQWEAAGSKRTHGQYEVVWLKGKSESDISKNKKKSQVIIINLSIFFISKGKIYTVGGAVSHKSINLKVSCLHAKEYLEKTFNLRLTEETQECFWIKTYL